MSGAWHAARAGEGLPVPKPERHKGGRKALRMIISPAKKMIADTDTLPWRDLPDLLPRTQQLLQRMRSMSYEELKRLWACNDRIAQLNVRRLEEMDLLRGLTPAILA